MIIQKGGFYLNQRDTVTFIERSQANKRERNSAPLYTKMDASQNGNRNGFIRKKPGKTGKKNTWPDSR